MIPLFLLGSPEDTSCADLLSRIFPHCGRKDTTKVLWEKNAEIFLMDGFSPAYLDAGGGIVIFKESFSEKYAPRHLLHGYCIIPSKNSPAQKLVQQSGLPVITCGGSFDTLSLSCMQEQTILTLREDIPSLDGTILSAGDFPLDFGCHDLYASLSCGAVLLLMGKLK